LDIIPWQVNRK